MIYQKKEVLYIIKIFHNFRNLINIIESLLFSIEKMITIIGMIGLTVLIAYGTILRYIFKTSILGMEETAILMGLYCYFFGVTAAINENDKIKVSILDDVYILPKIRRVMKVFSSIVSLVVIIAFAYISINYAISIKKINVLIVPLNISKLFAVLPLIVGFILMSIHEIKWLKYSLLDKRTVNLPIDE